MTHFYNLLQVMVNFKEWTKAGKDAEGGLWEGKEADRRPAGPDRRGWGPNGRL